MTNKERAAAIIADIQTNHLPRVVDGLGKGYPDENQLLVAFDHMVRARVLLEMTDADSKLKDLLAKAATLFENIDENWSPGTDPYDYLSQVTKAARTLGKAIRQAIK